MASAHEVGIANCYCMVHKLNISLFVFTPFQDENTFILPLQPKTDEFCSNFTPTIHIMSIYLFFADCRKVLEVGVVTWSLATAIIPVVAGFMPGLVLSRILVTYLPKVLAQGLLIQNLRYLLCSCIH